MTPPKETNKASITDPKEMKIYELSDKEFRIIFLRKFSELQERTNRQLNKTRKTMYEQNEKFDKEIETIKKKATEKLELKNTKPELKNSIEVFKNRRDHTKERFIYLEDRTFELPGQRIKKK